MKGINLIPAARRECARRRARAQVWMIAGGAHALVLGLAYVFCAGAWAGDDVALADKLQKLPTEIEHATQTIGALQSQIAETQSKLDAARAVSDQPDWGILLALIGESVGNEIVLNDLKLDPMQPIGGDKRRAQGAPSNGPTVIPLAPTSQPSLPQGYTVQITGLGRSQSAVSQFVLRLERIGLFDRVSLIKTSRQNFGDADAAAFQVEAVIRAPETASGS